MKELFKMEQMEISKDCSMRTASKIISEPSSHQEEEPWLEVLRQRA